MAVNFMQSFTAISERQLQKYVLTDFMLSVLISSTCLCTSRKLKQLAIIDCK